MDPPHTHHISPGPLFGLFLIAPPPYLPDLLKVNGNSIFNSICTKSIYDGAVHIKSSNQQGDILVYSAKCTSLLGIVSNLCNDNLFGFSDKV